MLHTIVKPISLLICYLFTSILSAKSQNSFQIRNKNSAVYAGIDVGSKGVKLSVLEIGKSAKKSGTYNVIKDTSINTDFISFTNATFLSTLNGLNNLYNVANKQFNVPPDKVFIVISSGVKTQAEKENKSSWLKEFTDSFRLRINNPKQQVSVIDVTEEARLSHIGIVPETKRYSTFLIDIGSGNTKGGYFPNGNTNKLKLFQLSWGTKSVTNETDKRLYEDKSLANFNKQLYRVLAGEAETEITYAVNISGAYNMSDNIAFSGGIAWSVATLISPELIDQPVVPVTYDDVVRFRDRLLNNYASVSDGAIINTINDKTLDKEAITNEVKRVNQVFDQRSLMAGTGLLLKIMRQFEGIYEKKFFYLVKNGQVGWISAYVNQSIPR